MSFTEYFSEYFEGPNGLKMHYEVVPGVVPQDTILIHGNLASNNWWKPAVNLWQTRAAQDPANHPGSLVMAEWRGSGKSGGAKSLDQLQMTVLAKDYIELAQYLQLKKANLIGHSTGGLIAMLALSMEPKLFSRVVLLDSVSPSGLQIVTPEVVERFKLLQSHREFLAMALAGTIYGEKRPDPLYFEQLVNDAAGTDSLNWAGVIETLATLDYWDQIKTVQNPALVLHGEFDMVLPLAESQKIAESLPNANFKLLDGQGHSCNVENPERFIKIVNEFLFPIL